jgi:Pre-SET motif
VTDSDGKVLIFRSPFKSRPAWSKVNTTTSLPPNFTNASIVQSKQPKGNLPHPPLADQNGSVNTSKLSVRHDDVRPRSTPKQDSQVATPAPPATGITAPKNTTSEDAPRRSRHTSPTSEGFLPHTSTFKTNHSTQKAPSPTPLAERPRSKGTTTPSQPPDVLPPTEPSSPQISVVIDNSQRAFTQSAATEELLGRSIQPIPATGAGVSERATTAKKPAQKEYRRQLLAELEKDSSAVYSRASSVEAVFGLHGFSARYSTDGDNTIRKRKAQPKAKKIRRKDVKLEWSSPNTIPQEPFEPEKLLPPNEQAHKVLSSKFDDAIEPPITFANEHNDRQLSGKFQFISSYIRRPGVEAAPQEGTGDGCNCIGGCTPHNCGCLIDDFGDEIDRGKVVPYQRVRTTTGKTMSVLRNEYLESSYMEGEKQEIIECNSGCRCGQDCWNRVVQKGRTLPLEVFMTRKCGFGESHQSSFFQLL